MFCVLPDHFLYNKNKLKIEKSESSVLAIHFRNHTRKAILAVHPLAIDAIQCGHNHRAGRIYWASLVDVEL